MLYNILSSFEEDNKMSKILKNRTKVLNYICAALMVLLIGMQFIPYWSSGDGSLSIAHHVWLPSNTDKASMSNWLVEEVSKTTDEFKEDAKEQKSKESIVIANAIAHPSAAMFLLGIFGAIFCVLKSKVSWMSLFALACGIIGLYAFCFNPAYALGSTRVIYIMVSAVTTLVALLNLVLGAIKKKD